MGGNGGVRGVTNLPTFSLASGRWSVREVFRAVKDDAWPLGFTPAALSPALWLDASDTSTITESGGDVSQWNNKGSLGNFTQASGALQPATGSTTLNGLNVMDFSADYLTAANTNEWKFLHDGTDYLLAVAWKPGTTADPNAFVVLFGSSALATGNVGTTFGFDDRTASSRNNRLLHVVDRGGSGTNAVVNLSSDNASSPNIFGVTTMLADPDNGTAANRSAMHQNDGSAIKNNTATNAVSTANPSHALQIGAGGNNVSPMSGSIAELIVVSGADATEGNRVIIRDYLNAKWGVY
jgi:hypothetical protein